MASGKSSGKKRPPSVGAVNQRQIPWGTVAAVVVIVALAAGFIGYPLLQRGQNAQWTPSEENRDPSLAIEGIVSQEYPGLQHVLGFQSVAYTHSPPFGGAHDGFWAACNGVVYPQPVRSENLVHSLEHGAIWITYNPDQVDEAALGSLRQRVEGQPYTVMSPYPGLDSPISLQSWGHQLKLTDAEDERIDQFIRSLRTNRFTHPEVGASCDALGAQGFDQDNPPPFAPIPPQTAVDKQTVFPENEGANPGGAPAPDPVVPGQ
ncbi:MULTISPECIES: DUF3105 domain-containing protein [unclassified Pseudonocardia]|uniref:DUF3105 domain-containing protein n=1 Tax=unclassified Pseudonocardia TaxID=2619320 RepID=UPI0001FFDA4A|nr:DUF3105 domain-containing protein [Pseudonocardia sp. Ae707_Ps1]OLM20439.1 hypothetical protein Ae707Ps1_4698 [Pseudonocardia sp. Ae707_Ps1]